MLLDDLLQFERRLRDLKASVRKDYNDNGRVNRVALRDEAAGLAELWFQSIRPELDSLHPSLSTHAAEVSAAMQRLHVLSRPNNLASSYADAISAALKQFKDRFLAPIQLAAPQQKTHDVLLNIQSSLKDPDEAAYVAEAVGCANATYWRGSIVLGWCAAINRLQQVVEKKIGFQAFNDSSTRMKNKTTGRYKHFKKEFSISNLSELQTVFDTDLLWVLEELGYIDSNEHQRLVSCFEYRNHSAHPGRAPVQEANLLAFYSDIDAIIFSNKKFQL